MFVDRMKAQEVMDNQAERLKNFEAKQAQRSIDWEALRRDRAKAQLVIDAQTEELEQLRQAERLTHLKVSNLERETSKLKLQIKEQKQILKAAGQRRRRPIWERILREIRRTPRNLFGRRQKPSSGPVARVEPTVASELEQPLFPGIARPAERYAEWIAENEPNENSLNVQRETSLLWAERPKISLLVPILDTPAKFLVEMFASVRSQTYQNWELCLIDAGSTRAETLGILSASIGGDSRIRFERIASNLGIADNTNLAMRLATGDFIACLDHDDILAPFALYELAAAILKSPTADVFYSDEDRWSADGARHAPFFKPDWSPELLYACMYIGHLTAYRRELVERVGGWRKKFDLSQDYDLALRVTEIARKIEHIPHVLYHWREHPQSGSAGGKPDARKTNLAALDDAIRRRGFAADIVEYPTANRVRLKLARTPKVSLVIPTDSAQRGHRCVDHLPQITAYPDYEIVIVTKAALSDALSLAHPNQKQIRYVTYDRSFNFSEKCNVGAEAATGDRLIFVNDDVESTQPDWIQNLIEPLENGEVGAVAPKLLYPTGGIQHAGLVTGVRGLIGTAFHEMPADTTAHVNFAQSMRNVSALSGACLAVRREDFFRIGGFDTQNTPVSHSDVDLCFRLREDGLRCIYTPFAALTHIGHVSIGLEARANVPRLRDKSSIYLLKRWGKNVTCDSYYSTNMRDWLYMDSPTRIRMFAQNNPASSGGSTDLLFVSHDLSLSGAPILLFHLAVWCKQNGFFVVVTAPEDGPLREKYYAAGIPVILDPLILTGHESFAEFARGFDCLLANSIRTASAVRSAHTAQLPIIWWMHETEVGEEYLQRDAKARSALPLADVILASSERTASVYRPFAEFPVEVHSYGIPDVAAEKESPQWDESQPLRFLVLGSIESRKGQDVFVQALRILPTHLERQVEFRLLGRVMDREFGACIKTAAAHIKNFFIDGPCDHAQALDAIRRCNVLVCSSRDEATPVTILEALSLGKAVVSTAVGGIPEILADGHNALLIKPADPAALAAALRRLIENTGLAERLGKNARAIFENTFTIDRFGNQFHALVREARARSGTREPAANI